MNKQTTEREHAEFSPSSLACRERCPHWTPETNEERGPQHAAKRGTGLHERTEKEDTEGLNRWDALAVQSCIEYTQRLRESLPRLKQEIQEEKVETPGNQFGYPDCILIGEEEAHIVDYKFGWNFQEPAETNPQMQAYACFVFAKFGDVNKVKVHLLYPNHQTVDVAEFDREKDYPNILARSINIVERSKAAKAGLIEAYNPSLENCLYCGNKGNCKALFPVVSSVASGYLAPRADSLNDATLAARLGDPATLTEPELRAEAERLRKVLTRWCKSVSLHNREYLLNGGTIPGFELSYRQGTTEIINPALAYQAVSEHLSPEEFAQCCEVSASQLAKLFGQKFPRGKQGKASVGLLETLQDMGALATGGPVAVVRSTKTNDAQEIEQ